MALLRPLAVVLAVAALAHAPPQAPSVNLRALGGHGRVAFVSRSSLWVADGTGRKLRRIATTPGLHPLQPMFSPDGKWLAFVVTDTPPLIVAGGAFYDGRVWLAHGDGSGAHPLRSIGPVQLVGWNRSDELAVIAGPVSTRVPFGALTTVRLVGPGRRGRVLLRARDVWGAVWSPEGHRLAVVTRTPRELDTLAVYPDDGGRPTVWARFRPHDRLNGMNQIVLDVAGWWRGFGIGVWVYGDGATHNNDATPFDLIRAPHATPRLVASTLSDRTTRVVAGARGALAVVADVSHGVNGGRLVWDAKQLQVCSADGACTALVPDRKRVTLDPAWSPHGKRLAFVEAPDLLSSGWPQGVLKSWYARHVLRLYDLRTKRVRTLAAARGATAPVWSADGRSLLYVSGDALWLLPALDAKPVRIAGPLFNPASWPAYYGQMAWPAQFAWSG